MVKKRVLDPLPILDEASLSTAFIENDIKVVPHLKKIFKYFIQNPLNGIVDKIPCLPNTAYTLVKKSFAALTTTVVERKVSIDGTIKLLIQLQDGHEVESVVMRHSGRNTLCVSSQVGCQMGCTFCATGTMGIIGDLCSGEILEQVVHANLALAEISGEKEKVRNIVFMGMGEPLMNYHAVLDAIRGMIHSFDIAPRHITLSTVGVIHRIKQLNADAPQVRLALSLHAPTQEMRMKIVPSAKAFPLEKLMESIDVHLSSRKNDSDMVMIEYVMLKGVNDSLDTAHILGKLLSGKAFHVNLIPYNSTEVDAQYEAPAKEDTRAFQSILRESYKLAVTVRENCGGDIDGACGQLAVKKLDPKKKKISGDIEDLMEKKEVLRITPEKLEQKPLVPSCFDINSSLKNFPPSLLVISSAVAVASLAAVLFLKR